MCSGEGYAAGIGMTIGSVFGRIAGREAAECPQLKCRREAEQSCDALLAEADRLMTVCNSCRYCEGLCAVFPAMEMRRAFPDGDLNYLANLCHACGACYTDCQFSPPHEFDVNVPQVLAQVRADSYAPMPGRARCAGVFERNGLAISIVAALSVAVFMLGFAAWHDPPVLFGAHTGPGAFYRLMPHNTMAVLFGAVFLYAIVAMAMGVRAFWRDIGEPLGTLGRRRSLWQAMQDAGTPALSRWRRRRLHERGRAAERPAPALSSPHLLRLHALLRRRPAWRRSIIISSAARRRIPWWDLPVVLGTLGGIGLSDRPARPAGRRIAKRDPALRRRERASAWTSPSSPCCS